MLSHCETGRERGVLRGAHLAFCIFGSSSGHPCPQGPGPEPAVGVQGTMWGDACCQHGLPGAERSRFGRALFLFLHPRALTPARLFLVLELLTWQP